MWAEEVVDSKSHWNRLQSPIIEGYTSRQYKIDFARSMGYEPGMQSWLGIQKHKGHYRKVVVRKYDVSKCSKTAFEILESNRNLFEGPKKMPGFIQLVIAHEGVKRHKIIYLVIKGEITLYESLEVQWIRDPKTLSLSDYNLQIKTREKNLVRLCQNILSQLSILHEAVDKDSNGSNRGRIVLNNLTPSTIVLESTKPPAQAQGERHYSMPQPIIQSFNFYISDLSHCRPERPPNKTLSMEEWRNLAYTAPEVAISGAYSCNADVWSLGCILFEILSGGERLVPGGFFWSLGGQKQHRYIHNKLVELQAKFEHDPKKNKQKKFSRPEFWIPLLTDMLVIDPKKRDSATKLLKTMIQTESRGRQFQRIQDLVGFKKMNAKMVYDISFEMLRLNILQAGIFGLFEDMYERMKALCLCKFEVYILIKMVSSYYLRHYMRLKEKIRYYTKDSSHDKYYLFTSMLDFKKINDIRERVPRKIEEDIQMQMRGQRGSERDIEGEVAQLKAEFPEVASNLVVHPGKVLRRIVVRWAERIVGSQELFKFVAECLCWMRDIDDYPEVRVNDKMEENIHIKHEEYALSNGIKLARRIEKEIEEVSRFEEKGSEEQSYENFLRVRQNMEDFLRNKAEDLKVDEDKLGRYEGQS